MFSFIVYCLGNLPLYAEKWSVTGTLTLVAFRALRAACVAAFQDALKPMERDLFIYFLGALSLSFVRYKCGDELKLCVQM